MLHQVIGCEKNRINDGCIQKCHKSASITNFKEVSLLIKKTKGNYHCIYNNNNFLNTDIVTDLTSMFSSFFIDLRDIKTETKIELDKESLIQLFANHLNEHFESTQQLKHIIYPSINTQYKEGI